MCMYCITGHCTLITDRLPITWADKQAAYLYRVSLWQIMPSIDLCYWTLRYWQLQCSQKTLNATFLPKHFPMTIIIEHTITAKKVIHVQAQTHWLKPAATGEIAHSKFQAWDMCVYLQVQHMRHGLLNSSKMAKQIETQWLLTLALCSRYISWVR